MNTEYIHKGRDNIIAVELLESGVNLTHIQYSAIFRMTLDFGGVIIDSNIVGEGSEQPFDWLSNTRLEMKLGNVVDNVVSGAYDNVKHVIYSADNPDGLVWGYMRIVVV